MAKRKKKEATAAEPSTETRDVAPAEMQPPVSQAGSQLPASPDNGLDIERYPPPDDWVSRTQGDSESRDKPDRRAAYSDPNVPFSIVHNNQVGVRLLKSERYKQVQLAFSSPVSGDIEGKLVAAGWKYRPEEKVYTKQYSEQGAGTSMVEAKRLYDELVEKISEEKGLARSNRR